MVSALKDEVYALVDELEESRLKDLRDLLRNFGKDPFINMDSDQRQRLHAAIAQSEHEMDAGQGVSIDEIAQDPGIL